MEFPSKLLEDLVYNISQLSGIGKRSALRIALEILRKPKEYSRDQSLVCIVEDIRDVIAIENTNLYKGVYHVLGGVISPIEGIGPEDLNISTL